MSNEPSLLTPAEVAALFRVDAKTVARWALAGRLSSIRTLGKHRRFREDEVRALLAGGPLPPVSMVERDGKVFVVRNSIEFGSAWPSGAGDRWFARRVDRRSGRVEAFANRGLAVAFLRDGEPDEE